MADQPELSKRKKIVEYEYDSHGWVVRRTVRYQNVLTGDIMHLQQEAKAGGSAHSDGVLVPESEAAGDTALQPQIKAEPRPDPAEAEVEVEVVETTLLLQPHP